MKDVPYKVKTIKNIQITSVELSIRGNQICIQNLAVK